MFILFSTTNTTFKI